MDTMTKTALPEVVVGQYSITEKMELADLLSQAGVFPSVDTKAKAFAAIEIGEALGMAPGIALMNIDFGAQGKPSISIHWQAGKMRELGWKWEFVEHNRTTCHIRFYPPEGATFDRQFSAEEAKAITVFDKQQTKDGKGASLGHKWNYKSWMEDMLYAYLMRRVVRRYEPQILGGVGPSDEEMAEEQVTHGVYEGTPPGPEAAGEIFMFQNEDKKHVLLAQISTAFQNLVYPLVTELGQEILCQTCFGTKHWDRLPQMDYDRLRRNLKEWHSCLKVLADGGLPDTSESWDSAEWSTWVFSGGETVPETPQNASQGTNGEPGDTRQPQMPASNLEGYDAWMAIVEEGCRLSADIPVIYVLALACLDSHVDKPEMLTAGARYKVGQWLTGGGLVNLRRRLEAESDRVEEWLDAHELVREPGEEG